MPELHPLHCPRCLAENKEVSLYITENNRDAKEELLEIVCSSCNKVYFALWLNEEWKTQKEDKWFGDGAETNFAKKT